MKAILALLVVALVATSANAQYDWKKCANAVIDTLIDGLYAVQAGINGEPVKVTKYILAVKNDLAADFNQCGQNPTFLDLAAMPIEYAHLELCIANGQALIEKIATNVYPNLTGESTDIIMILPYLSDFQTVLGNCMNVFPQKDL